VRKPCPYGGPLEQDLTCSDALAMLSEHAATNEQATESVQVTVMDSWTRTQLRSQHPQSLTTGALGHLLVGNFRGSDGLGWACANACVVPSIPGLEDVHR
jgi:hypothetical protein